MEELIADARVTAMHRMEPEHGSVLRAVSNSGYAIEESLADLVDNSIDAGASNVLIRVYKEGNRLTGIAVLDDGSGMEKEVLREAMRVAPSDKNDEALGHYGIGLKSASLSHANSLAVMSRAQGNTAAVRYTQRNIEKGWKLEDLDEEVASEAFAAAWPDIIDVSESGTLVYWSDLKQFSAPAERPAQKFAMFARKASSHLGLVFHRFLQSGLEIWIDLKEEDSDDLGIPRRVMALVPFPEASGARGYPVTFRTSFASSTQLDLDAHIWPPNSTDVGYKLDGKVAQRQGFYFFRNDRLIQAGGWNGWRNNDAEPHFSLARVAVELPPELTGGFSLNMQKNGILVPSDFSQAIDAARAGNTTMAEYVRAAQDAYRSAAKKTKQGKPVPASGLDARLARRMSEVLAAESDKEQPVKIEWRKLPRDQAIRIDPDRHAIQLNKRFRDGSKSAEALDSEVIKVLIFLLASELAVKGLSTAQLKRRFTELNESLTAALDVNGR